MAFVWPLVTGIGITYGYTSGKFAEWSGFSSKKSNPNGNSSGADPSSMPPPQQLPPPQVIVYESQGGGGRSSRSVGFQVAGVAVFVLAGYFWYVHKNGTKKVIHKVEETAEQTQDIVAKADANNATRFNTIDGRNTERAHTMEAEIRGEIRAGFDTASAQLYGLSQMMIEMLGALGSGAFNASAGSDNAGGNANEFDRSASNEKLLTYCEHAQEKADAIISQETLLTKKNAHLQDIRAEIFARQPNSCVETQHVTPGGPDTPMGPPSGGGDGAGFGDKGTNIFDMDANQTPRMTNISYKDARYNSKDGKDGANTAKTNWKSHQNSGILGRILNNELVTKYMPFHAPMAQYAKLVKLKNDVEAHKEVLGVTVCVLTVLGLGYNLYAGDDSGNYNHANPRMMPYSKYTNEGNTHNNRRLGVNDA